MKTVKRYIDCHEEPKYQDQATKLGDFEPKMLEYIVHSQEQFSNLNMHTFLGVACYFLAQATKDINHALHKSINTSWFYHFLERHNISYRKARYLDLKYA